MAESGDSDAKPLMVRIQESPPLPAVFAMVNWKADVTCRQVFHQNNVNENFSASQSLSLQTHLLPEGGEGIVVGANGNLAGWTIKVLPTRICLGTCKEPFLHHT